MNAPQSQSIPPEPRPTFKELARRAHPLRTEVHETPSLMELATSARAHSMQALGSPKRSVLKESAETIDFVPKYIKADFQALPRENNPGKLSWDEVRGRILKNVDKLVLIDKSARKGQLFYIDTDGTLYFKDRGTEIVRFLSDGSSTFEAPTDLKALEAMLKKGCKWATPEQIRGAAKSDSWSLFNHDGIFNISENMSRASALDAGGLFVDSKNKETAVRCILRTGAVDYIPGLHGNDISFTGFSGDPENIGAIRYLSF